MKAEQFLSIVKQAGRLKTTPRHCWTEADRRESVADHSWRIALMAMLLSGEPEFADTDMDRVIRMCLIHDLGEAFTGDIPTFEKSNNDEEKEEDLFLSWVKSFDKPQQSEWLDLLAEMKELKTREARTYKAMDKLEALISHNESDLSTWLPLEYDLQLTYGQENMKFSPYLTELRKCIDAWTRRKIGQDSAEQAGSAE
ncbi:MAG: HD domain-containing protein [Lachnospiraceae bacterium]|nr:HD domain-containing protein [Lachnospiraceae bacterium]